MIRIGILGAAGYTGGELIRLLLNHPEAEIVFANSESNAGNLVSDVHEGLIGETDLKFTDEMPFDQVDVIFFCFGHGKSEAFLQEHTIPENVKIIDLAQDFRIKGDHDYVYGLPEINKEEIAKAQHVANPGCFATCIQVALLPAAYLNLLKEDVAVNAITGSTGAGQKPGATTHFSWRNNNLSIYKPFQHQHIAEIRQSLKQVQGYLDADIDFIPYRGDFARGIFCTAVVKTPAPVEDVIEAYKEFYANAAFTHYSDKSIDLKQVVNTNKALVHVEKYGNKLLITSCIDNLLKGAVGQAVQNMNIMFNLDETALFDVYPLFDVNIVKGKGCKVWDENGQEYLDLYGGHAVISIGHSHPHYIEKVTEQLQKIGFYSNSVINKLQQELAERLGKISGYDDYQLFLINSGAEANENALKLASFTNGRTRVLSCEKAFHGRTSLAVEVTNNPKIIAPINDNSHVTYLPMNDLPAWEAELAKGDVCAVILECIQGVGGIKLATPEFAQGLAAACKKYGTILICDEIQCGYGRSGKFFAHQWLGIRPDIITVAKGIANGFPMGAVLIGPEFKPVYGQLGTTFGGNHLACAAALAVLDVFEAENLVENAHEVGEYLIAQLKELQKTYKHIIDVRGRGLMIGIDLDIPHKDVRQPLIYQEHCFTGCAGTNILRLLPPLCLTKQDADDFINRLKKTL